MHKYDVECECELCVALTEQRKIRLEVEKVLGEPIVCPVKVDLEDALSPMRKISDKVRFDQH
jgi:hypothetical protein